MEEEAWTVMRRKQVKSLLLFPALCDNCKLFGQCARGRMRMGQRAEIVLCGQCRRILSGLFCCSRKGK